MKLAFDADVLILAAQKSHALGPDIRALLENPNLDGCRFGSVLLIPELLSQPWAMGSQAEINSLTDILASLELTAADAQIAALAVQFAASYSLNAPDAVHLASAVSVAADGFVTNNSKDFNPTQIAEIQILFPTDLHSFQPQ